MDQRVNQDDRAYGKSAYVGDDEQRVGEVMGEVVPLGEILAKDIKAIKDRHPREAEVQDQCGLFLDIGSRRADGEDEHRKSDKEEQNKARGVIKKAVDADKMGFAGFPARDDIFIGLADDEPEFENDDDRRHENGASNICFRHMATNVFRVFFKTQESCQRFENSHV